MLDGRIARQTEWPDLNAVLTFVALAFSALTTVLLIWMFFKIRRLSAALMLVQQIQQIKSLPTEVPSFIDKRSTQATTQDYFDFDITLSWEHANLIFLLINTILLVTFIIRHMKTRKSPLIILEVTNRKQCVFVPIMKLPLCPSHSQIIVPTTILELHTTGPWYAPKLQVKWSSCIVTDSITERTFNVPNIVSINFWTAGRLSKILAKPFFVHLHAEHYGYLSQIPISANE